MGNVDESAIMGNEGTVKVIASQGRSKHEKNMDENCLTLDGFGSHLVPEALEVFAEHKILVVKEESNSSHVNQAYDQFVAKEDKRLIRMAIDAVRIHNKSLVLNQQYLIGILLHALQKVRRATWGKSFIKVNLHPDHRIPFVQWLRKIDSHLETGERFFKNDSDGLYEAMPALWKNLEVKERHRLISIIDSFYKQIQQQHQEEQHQQQ